MAGVEATNFNQIDPIAQDQNNVADVSKGKIRGRQTIIVKEPGNPVNALFWLTVAASFAYNAYANELPGVLAAMNGGLKKSSDFLSLAVFGMSAGVVAGCLDRVVCSLSETQKIVTLE